MSAGSTLSNLVLRTYGEQLIGSVGANMTIEHSVIEPADLSQPYLLDGLLPRWHANAIRLTKNTIRNFGRANSDDKNTLLFISRGETFFQQNTFHNNDSESLIHVPSSSYLVVENNNFINNSSFLEIDSLPWRLNIQNNMFIDTPPAIQYSNATNISGSTDDCYSHSDILNR